MLNAEGYLLCATLPYLLRPRIYDAVQTGPEYIHSLLTKPAFRLKRPWRTLGGMDIIKRSRFKGLPLFPLSIPMFNKPIRFLGRNISLLLYRVRKRGRLGETDPSNRHRQYFNLLTRTAYRRSFVPRRMVSTRTAKTTMHRCSSHHVPDSDITNLEGCERHTAARPSPLTFELLRSYDHLNGEIRTEQREHDYFTSTFDKDLHNP